MRKIKLFELILKAASAIIASAMSTISFIGIIGKLKSKAIWGEKKCQQLL